MGRKKLSAKFIIFLLFLSIFSAKSHERLLGEKAEFSYEEGSPTGPEHWGELRKDWAICGLGRKQSPIDISAQKAFPLPFLGQLRRFYLPAQAFLKNHGYAISLNWPEGRGGFLWIGTVQYNLKQLTWHSPSEHTIDGFRYSLEMQMVHQSFDNRTAVISILYNTVGGQPDPLISMLEPFIANISSEVGKELLVGVVNAACGGTAGDWYYRYNGSLTTPPCTEGVLWTVMAQPRTASWEQVKLLTKAIHDVSGTNARPIQPSNGRFVGFFGNLAATRSGSAEI